MIDLLFAVSVFDILDHQSFIDVCQRIGVSFDHKWLEEKYIDTPRGQGDVLLFQGQDQGCFLYLNLFQEPTDQHEIIEIGIRCRDVLKAEILESVMEIYAAAPVKSTEIKVGVDILKERVSLRSYPKRLPTMIYMDGKEVFVYNQLLQVY